MVIKQKVGLNLFILGISLILSDLASAGSRKSKDNQGSLTPRAERAAFDQSPSMSELKKPTQVPDEEAKENVEAVEKITAGIEKGHQHYQIGSHRRHCKTALNVPQVESQNKQSDAQLYLTTYLKENTGGYVYYIPPTADKSAEIKFSSHQDVLLGDEYCIPVLAQSENLERAAEVVSTLIANKSLGIGFKLFRVSAKSKKSPSSQGKEFCLFSKPQSASAQKAVKENWPEILAETWRALEDYGISGNTPIQYALTPARDPKLVPLFAGFPFYYEKNNEKSQIPRFSPTRVSQIIQKKGLTEASNRINSRWRRYAKKDWITFPSSYQVASAAAEFQQSSDQELRDIHKNLKLLRELLQGLEDEMPTSERQSEINLAAKKAWESLEVLEAYYPEQDPANPVRMLRSVLDSDENGVRQLMSSIHNNGSSSITLYQKNITRGLIQKLKDYQGRSLDTAVVNILKEVVLDKRLLKLFLGANKFKSKEEEVLFLRDKIRNNPVAAARLLNYGYSYYNRD